MRTDFAIVAALACVALAARLVPLTFSPLPFSIDGFALARVAADIGDAGRWRIDPADVNSYNQKLPGFSLLLAAVAAVGGLSPLLHVQLIVPILTCLTTLPAYLLGAKATGRRLGGFMAGLFVALFGSFLILTSAAAKQSIAFLVFPVAVLLFAERADPRKRALAIVLLLFLPFLHSLTTFLTLGMVAALVVLTHRRALARGRFAWRAFGVDVVTGPGLAAPALAYYLAVDLPFLSAVLAPDSFVLFLAVVAFLTALIAPMARPARRRIGQRVVSPATKAILPPVLGFALLIGNAGGGLFAGVAGTQPGFVAVAPAVAVLATLAVVGFLLVRRTTNRTSDLVTSMLVAPVALMLFAFLRGLDPQAHVIVYRSFDFMDYALAVLVAAAFVAMWKGLRRSRAARMALGAGLLGTLLATTPMAWDTPSVFGVQNVTTSEELQALVLLESLGARNVTTEGRLASVGALWFGYRTDALLPLRLRDGGALGDFDHAIVLERWTTVGAEVHPAPNLVVARETLNDFLDRHRVVYASGAMGDRIFVVQIVP